jgi:thioredoxin-related protein
MMKKILFLIFGTIFIFGAYSQEVKWYTIEEALEQVKKEQRLILIDIYADWCRPCKMMDANTFGNTVVAEYMNRRYYPVKFNAEQKEDVTIGGYTYKFIAQGAKGYHELAAALLNGQLAYPSVVFITSQDEKISVFQVLQGYYQPGDFDAIIKFIGDEHYKEKTWEQFQAGYNSPIVQ